MKTVVSFILLMLTLASCSSFSKVKYGHIRKVPAVPAEYTSSSYSAIDKAEQSVPGDTVAAFVSQQMDSLKNEVVALQTKSDSVDENAATLLPELNQRKDHLLSTERRRTLQTKLPLHTVLPPDLQLFFAILFIIAAILILLMCVFVLPYMAGGWIWILLSELILLYSGWRLIITAIAFLRARFGSAKSYEEH